MEKSETRIEENGEARQEVKAFDEESVREIAVPGETVATGQNYLPGDGTRREGKDIISSRYGIVQKEDRLVKIIPLSGVYMPRRGNIIIGKIVDVSFNGWMIDINSPYGAFLMSSECRGFVSKKDIASYYNLGDMLIAEVIAVKSKGVDLTMRERGLHKIEDGMIITINPAKVPRVIGKQGSMINLIKNETGCNIVVGQNGIIWIKGQTIEQELFAEKTINLIAEHSHVAGLTEKVKEFLEKEKKKIQK